MISSLLMSEDMTHMARKVKAANAVKVSTILRALWRRLAGA